MSATSSAPPSDLPQSGRSAPARRSSARPPTLSAQAAHAPRRSVIACRECDLLQQAAATPPGGILRCCRCRAVLQRRRSHRLDRALAFALAGCVLWIISNSFPVVGLAVNGELVETTLFGSVRVLYRDGIWPLAALILITIIVMPAWQAFGTVWLLLPLHLGRRPWRAALVFRWLRVAGEWGMTEVLMLGLLVALVKLAHIASVVTGVALWSTSALMLLLVATAAAFDEQEFWRRLRDVEAGRGGGDERADGLGYYGLEERLGWWVDERSDARADKYAHRHAADDPTRDAAHDAAHDSAHDSAHYSTHDAAEYAADYAAERANENPASPPIDALEQPLAGPVLHGASAAANGIYVCETCGLCTPGAAMDEHDGHEGHHAQSARAAAAPAPHCPRCGAHLHLRKPASLQRTWAFLIAATILYIPANVLPVMNTSSLFGAQNDTILSGVVYLWTSGSWPLAVIVFIASIAVPMLKILAIGYLAASTQRHSRRQPVERARIYRLVELVGRWSMLDIYVIAMLTALVQFSALATIVAGPAAIAFGAVVVLTMFAALAFDPRLIWDQENAR